MFAPLTKTNLFDFEKCKTNNVRSFLYCLIDETSEKLTIPKDSRKQTDTCNILNCYLTLVNETAYHAPDRAVDEERS